ncbi:MAG: YfhL family 4Fe-4S dicluster ferredoxin [Rhodospirillaceae bacterium]|nr:YfhL family 4Fe-4S dicluster ferredoxin [Rhodospirillaceae bacterium]
MAMKITKDCVFCGSCEMECPNEAISPGSDSYVIDPALCTECVGAHDEPQCVLVCPGDAIQPDPDHVETPEALLAKYKAIHA